MSTVGPGPVDGAVRLVARVLGIMGLLLVAGCGRPLVVSQGNDARFVPTASASAATPVENGGAIYQRASSRALFEDYKARRVGDVLTVVLAERTNARKSANAATAKDSSVSTGTPTLLGRPVTRNGVAVLNNEVGMSRSFEGQGEAAQSNLLEGSITVTVAEELPNGNLVVQGEKWLRINQGQEYIRLRGIVRPVDIRADNTVMSTQVADAQVAYGGTGTVAQSSAPGWLTRFFNSPLWPF